MSSQSDPADPLAYCENKATSSGSSFYYAFRFLPDDQRRAITALYAFCREVDDVVDECSDVGVARLKLQWWRDEVDRLFDGVPQHPVARALREHVQRRNLPREYFLEILDGMEMDLDRHRYDAWKDLALYCHRVAGVVGLLSAEIFGYSNRQTLKYAGELGTAFQLTNILRDVREDARRGRIYLPREDLARFGVDEQDILSHQHTPQVHALLAHTLERARGHYRKALALLPAEDRHAQRSGLIMAAIYQATLDEVERDGLRVLDRRIALTPLRKLWIAWRTARREERLAAHG
ncbi:MAG TPA: presqualene diphosphate synthase HpnD [Gammaproteobacteria bacterium]